MQTARTTQDEPRAETLERYFKKYPEAPREVIVKSDMLTLGQWFTDAALAATTGSMVKSYRLFSYDRISMSEMKRKENRRVPEHMMILGGVYGLRPVNIQVSLDPNSPYVVDVVDGPSRVRLLGEDLVAIRAPDGQVGLMSSRCPHRGASLALGRNEEGGLRCCYHGWKFSLEGTCVETPNEPPESPLTKKVRVAAYPCLERNGVIWTYMGSQRPLPPLPEFEWNLSPDNVPFMWRNYRACNWLQALEGDIDSSHAGFLHARLDDRDDDSQYITVLGAGMPGKTAEAALRLVRKVKAPTIEIVDTDYGAMYTAKRPADEEREYHRIHHYLYPLYTMVGGGVAAEELCYNGKVWLPMDDTGTLALEWQFRPGKPWTDEERQRLLHVRNPHGFLPATSAPGGTWQPRANASTSTSVTIRWSVTSCFWGFLRTLCRTPRCRRVWARSSIAPRSIWACRTR